jgi:hypothetical protein
MKHPAGKIDPLTLKREPATTEADELRAKGDVDFDKEVKRIRESVPVL